MTLGINNCCTFMPINTTLSLLAFPLLFIIYIPLLSSSPSPWFMTMRKIRFILKAWCSTAHNQRRILVLYSVVFKKMLKHEMLESQHKRSRRRQMRITRKAVGAVPHPMLPGVRLLDSIRTGVLILFKVVLKNYYKYLFYDEWMKFNFYFNGYLCNLQNSLNWLNVLNIYIWFNFNEYVCLSLTLLI